MSQNSPMRRRNLLVGGAVTTVMTAAVGWPGWLRKAILEGRSVRAQIEPEPGALRRPPVDLSHLPPTSPLKDALEQAQAAGKKVLVLVIPTDGGLRDRLGYAVGELLNHGSDADLAPMASAIVVCATLDEVGSVVGARAQNNMGKPLMVVLTPSPQGLQAGAYRGELPKQPDTAMTREEQAKQEEPAIDARIKLLSGLIAQGLGPAQGDVHALATQVRETIVKKPPRGGQWATSYGCGVTYEEGPERSESVKCGMGYVPERSRRFLHFLTASRT